MKALVIGYGVSGKSAAALLRKKGYQVMIADRKSGGDILPDSEDLDLEGVDLAILSPGIPDSHPLVQKVREKKIELISEIELGFRLLNNRCFGVTGSNGKTTAVLLAVHILNSAGIPAKALGNVGEGLSGYEGGDILVIELSSFQLENIQSKKLEVGIVLNITPNHLDRHKTMEEYVKAKACIKNCLKIDGELFVSGQVLRDFGSYFQGALNFEVDSIQKLRYIQLPMASRQSVEAALLLCKRCGVTDVQFLEGLKTFKRPAHRIEWVAEIEGVLYYNDSKASNIHAVMYAVSQFEGPLILIVGGLHKGSSYKIWIEAFQGKVKQVIAYGQAAPLMELELASSLPFQKVEKFADAVKMAKLEAKEKDTVLLSPGCSSYDQFQSFEQRGEEFKRLVREI